MKTNIMVRYCICYFQNDLFVLEAPAEGAAASNGGAGDVETGSRAREKASNRPTTDEIVPIYRRDCHEEVGIRDC